MRTTEQRDAQTLAITGAMLWFALVIGLGLALFAVLDSTFGIDDRAHGALFLGVVVAAGVLAIRRLCRESD